MPGSSNQAKTLTAATGSSFVYNYPKLSQFYVENRSTTTEVTRHTSCKNTYKDLYYTVAENSTLDTTSCSPASTAASKATGTAMDTFEQPVQNIL